MKKMEKQVDSAWVNETVSTRAMQIIKQVPGDVDDLASRIGKLLGNYRLWQAHRDTQPQVAQVVAWMSGIAQQSKNLLDDLRLMPTDVRSQAVTRMHTIGENYFSFMKDLQSALTTLAPLMNALANDLRKIKVPRGERPKNLEHALLSDVSMLIESRGIKPTDAAAKAAKILLHSQVRTFQNANDGKQLRKKIVAWRKKIAPRKD